MDELEMIKRAKIYIDKMANGKSPIDNSNLPDKDIVNNVKVTRCLFFVSNILDKIILNENINIVKHESKIPFSISQNELKKFVYSEKSISISEITNQLNSFVGDNMKKLSCTCITTWLLEKEYLKIEIGGDGKEKRVPTEKGNNVGIFTEERHGAIRDYHVTVYNSSAQKFIIYNMSSILSSIDYRYKRDKELWTEDEYNYISSLYERGKSVSEIAILVKRKNKTIISMLKNMNLI